MQWKIAVQIEKSNRIANLCCNKALALALALALEFEFGFSLQICILSRNKEIEIKFMMAHNQITFSYTISGGDAFILCKSTINDKAKKYLLICSWKVFD